MADKKISALPSATTPLAGTEVLPIVQGGVTDQVSVANLTSGRDVAVKKLNPTDNVVMVAGKGIDFSANTHAAGMTKEVLDWYEEGTYTPTVASTTGTITSYTGTAWYTRIGRQVTLVANVTITDAGTGAATCTISLPFTNNASVVSNGVGRENAISGALLQGSISLSGTVVNVLKFDNSTAIATNAQIRITITYFV